MMAGLVRLSAGARLMLDGAEWEVEECLPQSGRVVLRGAGGQRRPVAIRALVNDPGFRPVQAAAGPAQRETGLEDLTSAQREQLHLRVAHVLEAETRVPLRQPAAGAERGAAPGLRPGRIDGRTVRKSGGRPTVTEPVREAIYAVRTETLHRSRLSMTTRDRLIRQYVAERHGPEVSVP